MQWSPPRRLAAMAFALIAVSAIPNAPFELSAKPLLAQESLIPECNFIPGVCFTLPGLDPVCFPDGTCVTFPPMDFYGVLADQ